LEYRYRWPIKYRQLSKYRWKDFWKYRYRFQKNDIGRPLVWSTLLPKTIIFLDHKLYFQNSTVYRFPNPAGQQISSAERVNGAGFSQTDVPEMKIGVEQCGDFNALFKQQ